MGRYAVAAKLRRPELDRYFDPLKAVCGKQQGERVGDDGGLDAQVMREGRRYSCGPHGLGSGTE